MNALIDRPVLADAAKTAGVSLLAVHRKMRNEDLFKELIEEAINAGASHIEAEALRRAMGEVKRTVMYKGEPVRRVNPETGKTEEVKEVILSDRVLLKMLAALQPDKYGERAEVTHNVGTGVLMIPQSDSGEAFQNMLTNLKEETEQEVGEFERSLTDPE